jgi:hypothetical protein
MNTNTKNKNKSEFDKCMRHRLAELRDLFGFTFTKDMKLFAENKDTRLPQDKFKTEIKSLYKTMGLNADDLSIQGVETTKIINALDLPVKHHKRLMIHAKKEYFAEIAETLQANSQETVPTYPSDLSFCSWMTETMNKTYPATEKQVDDFFDTLDVSIPPPPPLPKSRKRQHPSNVAEPPSKKTNNNEAEDLTNWFYDVPAPPLMNRPALTHRELLSQQEDMDRWFQDIPTPPKPSDCNISLGSLEYLIRDRPVDDNINFDSLFE